MELFNCMGKENGFLLSGGGQSLEGNTWGSEAPLAEKETIFAGAATAVQEAAGGGASAFSEARFAPAARGQDAGSRQKLDLVREIPLDVTVILGKTRAPLGELFALNRGSIISLDQAAGSPVEILINNRPVARGEVVLVDQQFGVRITEHFAF